ncbi:MAG: thioredoxin TrxC [Deltaproteobacteria bacterium]|nr:thioredoxin TrxC [Deltaproteobacteria bacterium]
MKENELILRCPSCGTRNRVPRDRMEHRPVCGRCKAPLQAPGPLEVTDGTFQQDVISSPVPVLVDCWAPWCGPCRTVAPVLDELALDYAGRLMVAKLNVDENPSTSSRFGVQSIPTMLLFKGGREVDRIVGAVPRPRIEQALKALL